MEKIFKLQFSFFKKNLKDIISFSIILFISLLFFNSALIVNNNIDKAYKKKFNDLNTGNVFFNISKIYYDDSIISDIKKINGVNEVEKRYGIFVNIPVMMEDSYQDQNIIFYNLNDNSKLNKYEIVDTNNKKNNSIYLSNYTFIHSGLNLGDKFEYKINDIEYKNNIDGVVEEMQYGNYSSSIISEYLSDDAYNKVLDNNPYNEVVNISIKASDSEKTYNKISSYLSDRNISIINKNYDSNSKNQRLSIATILVIILMVFSSLILIVSLLVSNFKITESIDEEITNMGVLKALGYTSNEIIISTVMPYILSGIIVSISGIILSLFIVPVLSKVIEMQSGFIWIPDLDIVSCLISFIISLSLISLFTLSSAKVIKKLNPINAIRGIKNNKESKNYFEIDKTKGNIGFILSLKNFINCTKQNILLGIVLLFITLLISFAITLFYNVNVNPMNFVNTLVEEHPDVIVNVNKDIKDSIKNIDNVKNVIYYDDSKSIIYKGNSYKVFISENFIETANDLCYEGVNPSNSNEIAVGSKIKEKYNLNLNDYIKIDNNEYKIVGFIQSVNYSGEVIELTDKGYLKIDPNYKANKLYVYLDDDSKSSDFIDYVKDYYKNNIISTMDYAKSMDSALTMYISIVSIISIVIIIISLILVYLILFILISSIILKKKVDFGIYKSIGYKNNQLISHLIFGFMPSMIISVVLGIIFNKLFMKEIYLFIFKNVGAYKVSFSYPLILYIVIGIAILISTILLQIFISKKIKNISVYSLIKD